MEEGESTLSRRGGLRRSVGKAVVGLFLTACVKVLNPLIPSHRLIVSVDVMKRAYTRQGASLYPTITRSRHVLWC